MRKQISALRQRMAQECIDAYLVPTDDFHGSEYVGDYFKCRSYLSGFTGSAGTLIVTADWAGLWTDGRYFLQAGQQLSGSGISLCKMGEPGVPTEEAYLADALRPGQCLGFDGRVVTAKRFHALEKALAAKGIVFRTDVDLAGDVWPERPPLSAVPVWELPTEYSGRSRADKLKQMRGALAEKGAEVLLLSSLDDIAWLLNLRGGDVACCPVVLSFLALTHTDCRLFLNAAVLPEAVKASLASDGVSFAPYEEIYAHAAVLGAQSTVWLDEDKTSCALWRAAEQGGSKLLSAPAPTLLPKAVKNETEVTNERLAHLRDGAALTEWIFWLKTRAAHEGATERSAAAVLERLRGAQEHYLGPSFDPIVAFGPHGAIVHYSATEESDVPLEKHGFVLADTGGHYLEGTTDVTRTVSLGPLTDEMRRHYTLVLRSHLHLLYARFLRGCRGSALDMLARQPLWAEGLDFNHGTGHGVGYLLNVHEGPNSIRFRSAGQDAVLEPGMIQSDEPGLYLAGRYGIRLENLMVCEAQEETEFGAFLGFSALTMAPFDRAAIDPAQLSPQETQWLNDYHAAVYQALAPLVREEVRAWLAEETALL